jgi:hypothetical protein
MEFKVGDICIVITNRPHKAVLYVGDVVKIVEAETQDDLYVLKSNEPDKTSSWIVSKDNLIKGDSLSKVEKIVYGLYTVKEN